METPQQYSARILGYLDDQEPLEVLATTPSALAALVAGVEEEVLAATPAPGKWSVQTILAHLADAELVLGYRVRRILERDGVDIDAYDQNRWAEVGRYERVPVRDSLDRLTVNRRANLALLSTLTPQQLAHSGKHAERGQESVAHIIRLWAGHDLNHRGQIERILSPASAGARPRA
jgi:uncharacterized damage-inducible protein DinB